jgi:hypothetical protein
VFHCTNYFHHCCSCPGRVSGVNELQMANQSFGKPEFFYCED